MNCMIYLLHNTAVKIPISDKEHGEHNHLRQF